MCEALESTREDLAITAVEQLFQERGLPLAIRSDNGVPLPNALFNRSKLNEGRRHEAIDMKRPAELYSPSPRRYDGLPELAYPLHDRDVPVTACGRICMHRKRINVSTVLAGQRLGIKKVEGDNPFGPRLSPMS